MAIDFVCPACDKPIEIPDVAAGMEDTCRFCGAPYVAPLKTGAPAKLVTPAPDGSTHPGSSTLDAQPTDIANPLAIPAEAWRIYTKHFGLLIGVTLISIAILMGVAVLAFATSIRSIFGAQVLPLLFFPLAVSLIYVIIPLIKSGHSNIGAMFNGFRQWLSLILTALVLGICLLPAMALIPVSGFLGSAENDDKTPAYLVFGAAILLMAAILGKVCLALIEVIDKDTRTMKAFDIAVKASRGSWPALFGLGLFGIACGLFIPFSIVLLAVVLAEPCHRTPTGSFILMGVSLVLMLAIPYAATVLVLIYRDARGLQGTMYE